jgi:hypothetical protein
MVLRKSCAIALTAALFSPVMASAAVDVGSTVTALRLANTITGGFMPSSDPLFTQMVAKIQSGDLQGAASIAANSKYFANYMARRLALQMQTPALESSIGTDNDSTAFIVAHLVGTGAQKPSISSLWSENATYLVNVTTNGTTTAMHAADLKPAQLQALDWSASLKQVPGQNVTGITVANGTTTTAAMMLPQKHVGGFLTLSDRINDNSFAMYGATAGTNLRMIEGIWEISTGLSLVDLESTAAQAQDAPRFVPEYNPNFFHGQGQAACISCHGGGMSSVNHGYSAVADTFDFDPKLGLTYNAAPTVATMKSLGSDPKTRAVTATCDLVKNPTAVCNPDSAGASPSQGWDLRVTWSSTGMLSNMGWKGASNGEGLNALGAAMGQADIVYEFLTKRIVNEICPMGAFTAKEIASIAASANPFAVSPGTDDIRTIVAKVASHLSCQ